MNKYLLSVFLLCVCSVYKVHAQREPQFTNYMDNKLIYNPAYAGSTENICATILYHNQWSSFKSDLDNSTAPITQTFTLQGPLPISDKLKFGAGVHFLNDNLGFEHTFSAGIDFSYRKVLKNDIGTLSAGLSLGYIQTDLKGDWKAQDPSDTRLPGSVSDKSPDIGLGVYLTSPSYYAGVSALHLTQPSLTWAGGGNSMIPRAYYFIAGYNYQIPNTKFELRPGTLVRTDFAKTQYDLHIIGLYNSFVGVGLNYHAQDALSILGTLYLRKDLQLQGSYDITTSDARPFGGKIEVLLKYCFHIEVGSLPPIAPKGTRYL